MDKSKLRLEDMQYKGMKFYQHPDLYCFTSDAVTLANFVSAKSQDKVCDFCTGSGVIALLIEAKLNLKNISAVEIQPDMYELAKLNLEYNKSNVNLILGDVKDCGLFDVGSLDIIVCNPPYKKKNSSFQNQNQVKAIARHEIMLDLECLTQSVQRNLKYGGKFYVSFDANRSAELIATLKRHKLEPKRMFFTQPRSDKCATLVFIEAVNGGKEGIEVLPTVIANDHDGTYVQNIFDNYRRK